MSIAHVIASINQDIGGPAYSVPSLLTALEKLDYQPHLFTLNYAYHGEMYKLGSVKLHSYETGYLSRLLRGYHLGLREDLLGLAQKELSLIHTHGLWMYPNVASRVAANKYNIPLVISPRGMLEPWARERAKLKKKLAWFFYEKKNIKSARLFHVTAKAEAESLREFGITQPIAQIPNGVHVPDDSEIPERGFIKKYSPHLADKKWVLFLSRLDPKKGTDILLRAWSKIYSDYPDHLLVIAGPDLIGWRRELEKYVFENRMGKAVMFTGAAQADLKSCLLAHSEVLVLPTHSENFGNIVTESLSHRTPVITTYGAPWEELRTVDAGWWIENTEEELERTLREALDLSPITLDEKGRNGRKLVEQRYSWGKVATSFDLLYRWMFSGSDMPEFVSVME